MKEGIKKKGCGALDFPVCFCIETNSSCLEVPKS